MTKNALIVVLLGNSCVHRDLVNRSRYELFFVNKSQVTAKYSVLLYFNFVVFIHIDIFSLYVSVLKTRYSIRVLIIWPIVSLPLIKK